MGEDIDDRILEALEEKPMSISEIARNLDEKKYDVSKRVEILEEQGYINTHKIGRATACILDEDKKREMGVDRDGALTDSEKVEEELGFLREEESEEEELERKKEQEEKEKEGGEEESDGDSVNKGGEKRVEKEDSSEEPVDGEQSKEEDGVKKDKDVVEDERPERNPQNIGGNLGRNSEGFRGSKQSIAGSGGPRTIGVVSGKGGVGKTVVSINLGAAMEDIGEKVILLDADAEMSNVSIQLGMHTHPVSLKQVVEQDIHIMSAMQVESESGIRVVPTSLAAEEVDKDVLSAFDKISDDYVVLVDSPPGFERPMERVIDTCDELLFVTTPELPAVTDTYKLHKEARNKGKKVIGAVVNMYSGPRKHMSIQEIEKALEMPVIGVVDHSSIVPRSIFENKPALALKPYSKVSRDFKKIASEITGRDYEVSLMEKVKGFFL